MSIEQTDDQRLSLLTEAMVGYYRLGSEMVALYLAATLFEILVNLKLERSPSEKSHSDELNKKIGDIDFGSETDSLFLYPDIFQKYYEYRYPKKVNKFTNLPRRPVKQVQARLHNFRWLRNDIIHNQKISLIAKQSNVIEDWIIYLWSELAHDSFRRSYDRVKAEKKRNVISAIPEHTADYMIRAIGEVEFRARDRDCGHASGETVIFSKDFDNLFDLRRKLVFFKNYLSEWLPEKIGFLQTDILTTIDTTSAYIWMPLVSRDLLSRNGRHGVYDCSVSILATPLDLRIYMDFGGFTRDQRKAYYEFLDRSLEYEAFLTNLRDKQNLEVFDIDWYSAIFNRRNIPDWLNKREQALVEARSKIKKTAKPERSPITWNRCLHGYIISKFDLAENDVIDFSMIETKLHDIFALYQAFDNYKKRVKDEKNN